MMRPLLFVLLLSPFATFAQVQANDTSHAVMQLMTTDSTAFRKDMAVLTAIQPSDKAALSEAYMKVGWYYIGHGMPAFTLKYFLAANRLAEAAGDKESIAWSYNGLGVFYKNDGNGKLSLQYHTRGLALFKEIGNKQGIATIYNGIGDVYENEGNYTEALKYYFSAIEILKETGKEETLLWPYFNVGEVYMFMGRYDSALHYYYQTLELQREGGAKGVRSWTYNNISKALIMQHKYAAAENVALLSLQIADSLHELQSQINAHSTLSRIYEATGKYEKALEHYKAFTKKQAIIHNDEAERSIVKHQMQHDYDRKEELEAAAQAEKDKRTYIITLVMGLALLAMLRAFYLQRKSNKLKAELLMQNEEALQQKEMLMKEIHHRVKNNLQVTSILLDMQLASMENEQSKAAIQESVTRLNTMSLIHHQLYRNEETTEIEFSQFASDLHTQLHSLFGKGGQTVNFQNNIPKLLLDIDTAVPLGLILNELVTNSYKHAFNSGLNAITISIERSNNGSVLTYKDSGPGMARGAIAGSGLGMMIIKSLSRQIGGELDYNTENKMFIVSFRNSAEMKQTA